MKSWLKGGIWGIIIFIFIYFILSLTKLNIIFSFLNFLFFPGLLIAFFAGQVPISMESSTSVTLIGNIIFFLVNSIVYFLIGAFVGAIFKK